MAYTILKLEPGVGIEPTWSFLAALQERCNRRYANPAYFNNFSLLCI